ncbi:MAG: chorismate mutase, partial [Candidatus Bathyarchaeia archaeon]
LRIGKFKAEQGLQVDDPEREAQVLEAGRKASVEMGVDPNVIEAVLKLLIAHGRKLQREALSGRGASHPC